MPPRALVVAAGAVAAALTLALPASPVADRGFFVGFAEDLVKDQGTAVAGSAAGLGAGSLRVTVMWEPGQTQPSAATIDDLDLATGAVDGLRVVLAVYANAGSKAPLDAAARETYCAYVRSLLARYPSVRDVVIWNEPNKRLFWNPQTNAPALYEALLSRCYDVLHGAFADVNVIGLALSSTGNDDAGSTSPGAFIRAVGDAYRASGRSRRILDTVGFHPYPATANERPWRRHIQSKTIAQGDWNKLAYNLWLAFAGTAQPTPGIGGVSIWYLEVGFQTSVPAEKAAFYSGTENVAAIPDYAGGEPESPPPAEASPGTDQHTQVLDAIRLASCQPNVGAYFNFLLADEPALAGWQSGPYWADLTPKGSIDGFRTAIGQAVAGAVDCDALKGGRPSADFLPPAAPAGLQAEATTTPPAIALTWSPVADDASPVAYRVYRNGALVASTASAAWTDPNVAGAATYTYTVRAIDSAGNLGDASSAVSVAPPDVVPPAAPAGLVATLAPAPPLRVVLSWPAAVDNVGVVGYEVSRDGLPLATTGATGYVDSSVGPSTAYSYAIIAVDAAGNRSAPATAAVSTPAPPAPDSVPPSVPTRLSAKILRNPLRVQLGWRASADDVAVVAYRVYRDGVPHAETSVPAYVDATVSLEARYVYVVRAVDGAGNESGPAKPVKVKTPRR